MASFHLFRRSQTRPLPWNAPVLEMLLMAAGVLTVHREQHSPQHRPTLHVGHRHDWNPVGRNLPPKFAILGNLILLPMHGLLLAHFLSHNMRRQRCQQLWQLPMVIIT